MTERRHIGMFAKCKLIVDWVKGLARSSHVKVCLSESYNVVTSILHRLSEPYSFLIRPRTQVNLNMKCIVTIKSITRSYFHPLRKGHLYLYHI